MSIWKNGKLVAGGSQALPLLISIWSDHILDDMSWLRADTFSWQRGSVYQAVYQHLANDIDGKTLQSETIGGTTIQFYLADDGHKICPASEESNVLAVYNATGVAWYFIIDTTNQRFKLPRTKFGFVGLRDTVGNYVQESLPNIKGQIDLTGISNHTTSTYNANDVADSALYNNESITAGRYHTDSSSATGYNRIRLNASRSSSAYQDNAPVQQRAVQMYLYFYVGQFTQTALENTAGVVTEDFNELNAHKVIEFQAPTAENNYTWYRKYADGWVEQGGVGTGRGLSIVLPVTMLDTNYTLAIASDTPTSTTASTVHGCHYDSKTTTGFCIICLAGNSGSWVSQNVSWQVSGMAA